MTYTENHLAQRTRNHSIKIDAREKTLVTGVEDVDNFNESEINIITTAGYLTITGNDLHITRLNLDEGQLMGTQRPRYALAFNDYLIGAADSPGGADRLTYRAPIALYSSDNGYLVIN